MAVLTAYVHFERRHVQPATALDRGATFVNMSGDKDQEYFSDGLSEELLNDLARVNDLQVAARTSAFSFKGKDIDIGTVARKLNVGAILEGSVRRSGNTIRVTAQLNNAVTGFHLWSQTYDRNFGDVLQQTGQGPLPNLPGDGLLQARTARRCQGHAEEVQRRNG